MWIYTYHTTNIVNIYIYIFTRIFIHIYIHILPMFRFVFIYIRAVCNSTSVEYLRAQKSYGPEMVGLGWNHLFLRSLIVTWRSSQGMYIYIYTRVHRIFRDRQEYMCMYVSKWKTNIYIYIYTYGQYIWWGPICIYIRTYITCSLSDCIHCIGSTLYMTPCPESMARPWYPPPFVYPAPEFAGVVAVVVIVVRSSSFTNTQLPNLSASSLQKETWFERKMPFLSDGANPELSNSALDL